jgi:hypothetical protein
VANLYGVANTPPALQSVGTIGGATVTCPAGVETNVLATTTIAALDRGIYYPVAWGVVLLQFGATQSTTLWLSLRVNSGADLVQLQCNIPAASANIAQTFGFAFAGPPMATAFWPPGASVQVSVLVTGFGVTAPPTYSLANMGIFRAPDQ